MNEVLVVFAIFAVSQLSFARIITDHFEPASFNIVQYRYLSNNESQGFLEQLVSYISAVNPDVIVKVSHEGSTYEKRPIKSYTFQYRGRNNPIVLMDAGTHAREWHSQSMAFFFMRKLIDEARLGRNGLIYDFTFVIVPT